MASNSAMVRSRASSSARFSATVSSTCSSEERSWVRFLWLFVIVSSNGNRWSLASFEASMLLVGEGLAVVARRAGAEGRRGVLGLVGLQK